MPPHIEKDYKAEVKTYLLHSYKPARESSCFKISIWAKCLHFSARGRLKKGYIKFRK